MSEVLSQLKKVAIEEELIIVTISQLLRGHEKDYRRPKVEHLAHITDLAHVDKTTLLYREEYYFQVRSSNNFSGHEIIEFLSSKKNSIYSQVNLAVVDQKTFRIYDERLVRKQLYFINGYT